MRPLPRTTIPKVKVPAPAGRRVSAALDALDDDPSKETVDAVLAAAATLPMCEDRVYAEWQALQALADLDAHAVARRVWESLAARWSEHAPFVDTAWGVLARVMPVVGAKVPAKLRDRIRTAWAWGTLSQTFQYMAGTSVAAPPKDASAAWRQGCIEITRQDFARARACVDAVQKAKGFEYSGKCLDIMLRREQGDADGARTSYLELVALARKKKAYAYWDVIAALFVILDVDDARLAKDILGAWTKGKAKDSAIFAS